MVAAERTYAHIARSGHISNVKSSNCGCCSMTDSSSSQSIEIYLMRAKVWLYVALGAMVAVAFAAMAWFIDIKLVRYATLPIAAFGVVVAIWAFVKTRDRQAKLIIEEDGLVDTRLPVGKIFFRDIAEVKVGQMHQEINRILLRLKDSGPYLRGLSAWQRFRTCPFGKQRGGDVEIDISMLDIDGDELEGLIEVMRRRV